MGSESWSQWYEWKGSLPKTLKAAQKRELAAQGFASLAAARRESELDGTASVLDIHALGDAPEPGVCWVPSGEELEAAGGTATPARVEAEELVEALAEELGRGESVCVVAYAGREPKVVFFAGWSFD